MLSCTNRERNSPRRLRHEYPLFRRRLAGKSASVRSGSPPRQCLSLTCEPILTELAEKLQTKRGHDASKAAETAEEIRAFSKIVPIPGALKVIAADPDDDAILECAVIGQAQYLVSGDRHLLALGSYQEIQIVKAAEFLKLIQAAPKA